MRNINVTYYIVDAASDRTDIMTPTITEDISLAILHLMEYADTKRRHEKTETTSGGSQETQTTTGH